MNPQEQVEHHLKAYEDMQQRHLHLLTTTQLPDLASMSQERDQIFSALQNSIQADMDTAGQSPDRSQALSRLKGYEDRLNRISHLDAEIRSAIQDHKTRLKRHLDRMKHGKTAMKGYGQLGNGFSPYVVSMNR